MASDSTTADSDVTVEEAGPPMPAVVFRIVNPLMKLLLRSPFHGVVSESLLLLTFTGRKSGREYTTPVGYRYFDDSMVIFTHSDWWKNLRGGATVTLHLRGDRREAEATPITDPADVAEYLARLIDEHGVEAANRIGLSIHGDGAPTVEDIQRGLEDTVVIELDLANAAGEDE